MVNFNYLALDPSLWSWVNPFQLWSRNDVSNPWTLRSPSCCMIRQKMFPNSESKSLPVASPMYQTTTVTEFVCQMMANLDDCYLEVVDQIQLKNGWFNATTSDHIAWNVTSQGSSACILHNFSKYQETLLEERFKSFHCKSMSTKQWSHFLSKCTS